MLSVSIIIPMYNVSQYLQTCVQSVVDQQMQDGTFEVLMIDDGSPDQSRAVADALAQKYGFIKVFSQDNKGLGGARNTGIKNSKGKYIVFLDADDMLIPDSLSRLVELAETNALDILEFGARQINELGDVLATITWNGKSVVYNGITYYNAIKYMNSACNKLYSRRFLINNELQFTEKIYREDFEFNTRSFFYTKRIMATDTLGAAFLQSTNSITRNQDRAKQDKYIRDFVLILELINKFEESKKEFIENNKAVINYFEERMTVSNIVLFYYMFKRNYSYQEMKKVRKELIGKNLYHDNFQVSEKTRDLFRKVMLKNFYLFNITQPLKKIIHNFKL